MRRTAIVVAVLAIASFFWSAQRAPRSEQLLGLWSERGGDRPDAEVRFYYFHEGGKGLYRYGQVGYNQTHSFDWKIHGDELELVFRKRGERAKTRFVLGEADGRRTLTLLDDPRGDGRVIYRLAPARADVSGPLSLPSAETPRDGASRLAGRIWMDLRKYATGGAGFVMYQLSDHAAQPGWLVGWHHVGDFDDWTTEQLVYKEEPLQRQLRLRFLLRGDEATTPMSIDGGRGARALTLDRDPRNFLHKTRLVDAGPSF